MLAYVFVHRPGDGVVAGDYAERLCAFHRALALSPPDGFRRSWIWRVDDGPLSDAFEDWYLVDDWAALGSLNAAAVRGRRQDPHDAVAAMAGAGNGAIYAVARGEPTTSARHRLRLSKPAGISYPAFEAALDEALPPSATVYKRQMVLGPDQEFLIDCAGPPSGPVAGQAAESGALQLVFG